jgi:alkylation response protein AidB-like acyl-CoA dehydrogenase
MMDLQFTPADIAFRNHVRQWLAANTPKHELETLDAQKAWHRRLYEVGFVGMGWPKTYGGQEATPLQQAIVADEMARAEVPGAFHVGIYGATIIHRGTAEQQARFLKKMLSGEELWCQLYSEPNAGSDLASLRTRAENQGDHFEINGQKVWTSDGYQADWGLLLARTDPTVPKYNGISCFLIDMRQPGVEVRRLKQITGKAEFCEVFFTRARVEKENLVGAVNQGWQIAQTTLGFERGAGTLNHVTTNMISLHRLIELTKGLQNDDGAAFDDPLVRQKLGRAYVEIEVMRYSGLRMLSRLEKGQQPGPESSIAKLVYSEFDKRYHQWMTEILGPYGGMIASKAANGPRRPANWAEEFLFSFAYAIGAGTSEIQRNIIGERVLGLPKEPRMDRIHSKRAPGS